MSATHPGAKTPVHVNGCNSSQGATSASQFGYVPAYVPPGQHAWSDPYGRQYYQSPALTARETQPTLKIDYVNVTSKALREVEFGLVAGGSLVAEVRDIGTFSHGAEIKHVFALRPSLFPLGSAAPRCVPLRAIYQNGAVWTNPHLPQIRPGLYK